jgi:hypothetical protein
MNTTATTSTATDVVLGEDEVTWTTTPAEDGVLATWTADTRNGLWTITDLEDGDFLIEGPTHHQEDTILDDLGLAMDFVLDNARDRRRSGK